jgi:hypothetical protein
MESKLENYSRREMQRRHDGMSTDNAEGMRLNTMNAHKNKWEEAKSI